MTKEEKIKEVYKISGFWHDENGWTSGSWLKFLPVEEVQSERFNGRIMHRPKSLSYIENNNFWTKINSKEDLPKEECEVFFIKNDLIFTGYFYYNQFNIGIFSNKSDCYFFEEVTHYQVFKKPSLPIY